MADKTTAAALQRQSDQILRAQEKIDHDPEEAKAQVEASVTVSDGSPITVQDMLGLFIQLQQSQQAMQQQLVTLMAGQQQQNERRAAVATKEELERVARKQSATRAAWAQEPQEPVWIEPDIDERRVGEAHNGEMPPRVFQINGIQYAIKVGEVTSVPSSIAALVRHTQGAHKRRTTPA